MKCITIKLYSKSIIINKYICINNGKALIFFCDILSYHIIKMLSEFHAIITFKNERFINRTVGSYTPIIAIFFRIISFIQVVNVII